MLPFLRRLTPLALIFALVSASSIFGATLEHFDLGKMVDRADKIFRGTVLAAQPGTIEAGGGRIPIVTYTIRVDEAFKGTFDTTKGEKIAELRMIGKLPPLEVNGAVRHSPLPDLPHFTVGSDHLLFSTRPGGSGLSTTMGLGQGNFRISKKDGEVLAVNGFDNLGLFKSAATESAGLPASGPVPYPLLADQIRAELSR